MSKIVVDAKLVETLRHLKKAAELCDSDGNVLGHFQPPLPRVLYGGQEPPPLSADELRERMSTREGYSTAEVLAYLEKLD